MNVAAGCVMITILQSPGDSFASVTLPVDQCAYEAYSCGRGRKMMNRFLSIVVGLTTLVSLALGQVVPQRVNAKSKAVTQAWKTPRTLDGHPDFQGFWANNNATP